MKIQKSNQENQGRLLTLRLPSLGWGYLAYPLRLKFLLFSLEIHSQFAFLLPLKGWQPLNVLLMSSFSYSQNDPLAQLLARVRSLEDANNATTVLARLVKITQYGFRRDLLWQSSLPLRQSWQGMRKPRLTTPLRAPLGRSFQFQRNNSKRILLPCWLTRSTPKYLRRSPKLTSHLKLQLPAPVGSQPSLSLVLILDGQEFSVFCFIATRCFKRFGGRSYSQSCPCPLMSPPSGPQ